MTWNEVERKLSEWERDPSQLDEEGLVTPSVETIRVALQVAREKRKHGYLAPDRVVPDVDGGVVLEWRCFGHCRSVHVLPEDIVEEREFLNGLLVNRRAWLPAPAGAVN